MFKVDRFMTVLLLSNKFYVKTTLKWTAPSHAHTKAHRDKKLQTLQSYLHSLCK